MKQKINKYLVEGSLIVIYLIFVLIFVTMFSTIGLLIEWSLEPISTKHYLLTSVTFACIVSIGMVGLINTTRHTIKMHEVFDGFEDKLSKVKTMEELSEVRKEVIDWLENNDNSFTSERIRNLRGMFKSKEDLLKLIDKPS